MTEPSDNPRKIPKAIFIENTEAWAEKYTCQAILQQMNELYQKYKFMETSLLRGRESMKLKLPDIKKTLEMVRIMKDKSTQEETQITTNFLISDNIWAKATVPNDTGKVGLWLGANTMVEYSYGEAIDLLEKNLKNAEIRLASASEDLNFCKDQITTTEVNIARVYNQSVSQKTADDEKKKAVGSS